jgi:hypothetical protein
MRRFLLVSLFTVTAPAIAQEPPATIDPGMTKAQVIDRLGKPATERSSGGFTYLFYVNGCERTCGMNDLVTLRADTVIDAIFRAASRAYSGRSSSPNQGYSAQPTRAPLKLNQGAPDVPPDSMVVRILLADPVPPATRLQTDTARQDTANRSSGATRTDSTRTPPARPDSIRPQPGTPPAPPVRPVTPPPPRSPQEP